MTSKRTVLRISIGWKAEGIAVVYTWTEGKSYTNSFTNHQLFHKEHFSDTSFLMKLREKHHLLKASY